MSIYGSIPDAKRPEFSQIFLEKEKNPVVAFGFNAWLGWLGADRFYCGQTLLGIIKLLTLGGLGLWTFIDLFLIPGTARDESIKAAREIRDSMRV
ncbi:MAG TPA: TM2 domain-containing protein [Caulobacterales bacterium]|nr:TM2 domain-containing protein [Caulobacterales bacterium]